MSNWNPDACFANISHSRELAPGFLKPKGPNVPLELWSPYVPPALISRMPTPLHWAQCEQSVLTGTGLCSCFIFTFLKNQILCLKAAVVFLCLQSKCAISAPLEK